MNRLFATIATLAFAGSVQAASDAEVYHGWAVGNSELSTDLDPVVGQMETVPGSLDAFVYNGFERNNSELAVGSESLPAGLAVQPEIGDSFKGRDRGSSFSIYNGFEAGNPDL